MSIRATSIRVEVGQVPNKKDPDVIYFPDFESAAKVLSKNRVELLQAIKREQPESIYALAEIVDRDQGNVTKDVKILEKHGFVEIRKTTDGGRTKSEPTVESEGIEMLIQLGAGAFGLAKDMLEEVSGEFKGKNLERNKKYVRDKGAGIVDPVRDTVKRAVKRAAEEFDIVTKNPKK